MLDNEPRLLYTRSQQYITQIERIAAMKNIINVTVIVVTVAVALGCASTRGRELPLGSSRELEFSPLPEDVKLLYVLNAGAVLRKPEISVIYGSGLMGFVIAGVEQKYKGSTRGGMLSTIVSEEPGSDLVIWFSPRPIPFASEFKGDVDDISDVDGVKAYVTESGDRQEWNFLPSENVLVSAESEEGARKAARMISHVYSGGESAEPLKKWRKLFRPLSGKRVIWGRLAASKPEDLAHFKKYCEGLYLIAAPLLRILKPQHVSFALALEGFETVLSFAFAESSARELKKAVRACKCTPALKETLMSAPVSSDKNGTVLTIRSNLRDLSSLVEDLYDEGEDDEAKLEYPKEVLRSPPHMPRVPEDDK